MTTLRYGLITIDTGVNLGNRLIEWAGREVLGLPSPDVRVSMFKPISDHDAELLNNCAFVLLPGSTIFADAPGNSEAMRSLHKIMVPIYCLAASGWAPYWKYLGKEILERITPPIGARDPHTLEYLESMRLDAQLVGCPTGYIEKRIPHKRRFLVFGFGRAEPQKQVDLFKAIRKQRWGGGWVTAVQEKAFCGKWAREMDWFAFSYDRPEGVYRMAQHTLLAVTGRLHGALPAMSQGADVSFFGDPKDSRFSLLSLLFDGALFPRLPTPEDLFVATEATYRPHLEQLKANLLAWKEQTLAKHLP